MKCLNCGCKDLFPVSVIDTTNLLATCGRVEQTVNAYACKKCGHVELFIPQAVINKKIKYEKQQIENEKLKNQYSEKIAKLEEEIEDLKNIINDENQTVKTVKQTEKTLSNKKNELKAVQNKLHSVGLDLNTQRPY